VDKLRTIWLTTDAHNLTHDIDGPLRKEDANLAKSLCEKVVALENQMVGQIVTSVVANQAQVVGDALQQARPLLRENGSSPTPVIVQTCDLPVGAVTTQPLTETRLTGAIAQLRQASTLAAAGDGDGAQAAFSGDAHNLTHDIDGPLRTGDHDLAVNLCKAVVDIEQHLGANYDASVMQDQASTAADMIEQGGRELGILQ
jgi:hypothetical protein